MPVVDFQRYCAMLDKAADEHYAYPAVNVLEVATLNAAIEGFAAAQSDGIVQISLAAGAHTSGGLYNPVLGAVTLAEHARRAADCYDINIAIHSDHCPTAQVSAFLEPLIQETAQRRAAGHPGLFNSHMYDGSDLPMEKNLANALPLLERCRDNELILEVESGVVGGEEDGVGGKDGRADKLYTTPEDMALTYATLSRVEGARFMLAAAFGNVHGVYKPGHVVLRPEILKAGQEAVMTQYGDSARLWLVFHGGSGSSVEDVHRSIEYGVVKMNIHTDTQYAFTRGVVDHMMKHYDGVLKVDGEVGVKESYLASTWLDRGRERMIARVVEVCETLGSAGKSLGRS